MTPTPPPRVRWASRAMALGLVVFAIGLVVFTASRLAGASTSSPAPSLVALASPTPTPSPTPPRPRPPPPRPIPTPTPTPPPTLEQLVGQKLVVRMDGNAPSKALLARAKAGEIGGVVLFRFQVKGEGQIRAAIKSLQAAAKAGGQPPLLIAIDQEGGGIRAFPWAQPVMSASRMGRIKDLEDVKSLGAAAGLALAKLGVNVDLAPVADVPGDKPSFMRDTLRTFSSDPDEGRPRRRRRSRRASRPRTSPRPSSTSRGSGAWPATRTGTSRRSRATPERARQGPRAVQRGHRGGRAARDALERDVHGARPGQRRRLVARHRDRPPPRGARVHRRDDHRLAQRDRGSRATSRPGRSPRSPRRRASTW